MPTLTTRDTLHMPDTWIRRQMTIPNLILLFSIAIGIGGYVKAFQSLETRVEALELRHAEDQREVATVYQRRDVQDATLSSINQRLGNIEADLKDLKNRRSAQ